MYTESWKTVRSRVIANKSDKKRGWLDMRRKVRTYIRSPVLRDRSHVARKLSWVLKKFRMLKNSSLLIFITHVRKFNLFLQLCFLSLRNWVYNFCKNTKIISYVWYDLMYIYVYVYVTCQYLCKSTSMSR